MSHEGKTYKLTVRWSGKEFTVFVQDNDSVYSLKRQLQNITNVEPKRQKIIGLKLNGKPNFTDENFFYELNVAPRIQMTGTPEAEIIDDDIDVGDVLNDFEESPENIPLTDRLDAQSLLNMLVGKTEIQQLNPPRQGKKLLVLDVDYTILDHKTASDQSPLGLMRPHLHDFLTVAYKYYDIGIWSATSMKTILKKLMDLSIIPSDSSHISNNQSQKNETHNYQITFIVDRTAMLALESPKYGSFRTKPLAVVWEKYKNVYTPENTIMFDDLGRNFVMNPQNGLKVKPFRRNEDGTRPDDHELLKLLQYLLSIRKLSSLSSLHHKDWKEYVIRNPPEDD